MSLKNASDVTTRERDGMYVVSFDSGVTVSTHDGTGTWMIETVAGEAGGEATETNVVGMRHAVMTLGRLLTQMGDMDAYVQSYDLFRFYQYMESGGTAPDPGPVDLNDPESLAKATDYLLDSMTLMVMDAVLSA